MEKRIPAYKLAEIKQVFSSDKKLRMTATALTNARAMGFLMADIVNVIQQLKNEDFVKSMTTFADHRVCQDVYYTEYSSYQLYIKFQMDDLKYFVISFKEKEQ